MSRYYHYDPPRREDYLSEYDYQEAVATWENAEDDYVDNYVEMRQLAREKKKKIIHWKKSEN